MSDKGGQPELRIHVIGAFRVLAHDGEDLTPRGRKARALLAMLALTPTRRRSRPALQDKLWSDRGAEQGAASLRQTLTEIRRSLGDALPGLPDQRHARHRVRPGTGDRRPRHRRSSRAGAGDRAAGIARRHRSCRRGIRALGAQPAHRIRAADRRGEVGFPVPRARVEPPDRAPARRLVRRRRRRSVPGSACCPR